MGNSKTVLLAMSGGVDSSVAAVLLAKQGYKVIGVTLIFRPCDDDGKVSWCCGTGAQESARAVAHDLGIPHYTLDCAKEFEQRVLRPSWNEYRTGRTPSPCILCNEHMKFHLIMEMGRKLDASKIATGHYARINRDKAPCLLRGLDPNKDQSYFLFSLSPRQLDAAIFPLGDVNKTEVRRIAKEMGLTSAERPESQDACFVMEDGGFSAALGSRFKDVPNPGIVVDPSGKKLGEHAGVHLFTIGQRKGLGIALGHRAYVSNIDAENSRVTLTSSITNLESTGLTASSPVWSPAWKPEFPARCEAQIRYRHKPVDATITEVTNGIVHVSFDRPERAVAPGQAVVFYKGERVIGGAWIDKATKL